MRNCFIPYCDAVCRDNPRRMMFRAPRDPEIFEKWFDVLPKHRPLKIADKVCERHFLPEEIVTSWTHTINGQVAKVDRGKPALLPTAVPSRNIDNQQELMQKPNNNSEKNRPRGPYRKREANTEEQPSNRASKKRQIELMSNDEPKTPIAIIAEEIVRDLPAKAAATADVFDNLYDDAFEVALPNTLWGLHRDPDRKFIVFTCWDSDTMTTHKVVHISETFDIRIYVQGAILTQYYVNHLSIEYCTDLLAQVDDDTIFLKEVKNDKKTYLVELDSP